MKISNPAGSNESVRSLCSILGTSDLSKALDAIDRDVFEDYAAGECYISIEHDLEDPDYCGLYIVEGNEWDVDAVRKFYDGTRKASCVGRLAEFEDGVHWDIALKYLKNLLECEIYMIKYRAKRFGSSEKGKGSILECLDRNKQLVPANI